MEVGVVTGSCFKRILRGRGKEGKRTGKDDDRMQATP
jgi:hypothetical protein